MSQCPYPDLFSPIQIGKFRVKNRVVSSPHSGGPNLYRTAGNGYSNFTETAAQYFGAIARGGAGIVHTGHLGVDPRFSLGSNQELFNFFNKEEHLHEHTLPVMHMMTDLIHTYGAIASLELNHCGHYGTPVDSDQKLIGPVSCISSKGKEVVAMDRAEMERVADYFANAALIGKRGGYDMINVHAAHNWLLGNFFSPLGNTRDDEFGGNWKNRARFPRMVLERIREAIGPDMLIQMRFSVSEILAGGITLDEAANTIEYLSDLVDVVQCSAGKIHNVMASGYVFPMPYMQHGANAHLAAEMKRRLNGKVVFETIGGINQPEMADQLVRDGMVDLVGMARSFIADPDWAEKARCGHADEIRPCIRCLRCLNYANPPQTGTSVCTVNARRVIPHPLNPSLFTYPNHKKHVAVIGGGAAGMAAAVELSRKGHDIELYERSDKLGGRLFFADHVVFKEDVKRYREYLTNLVNKAENIHVHLNTAMSPEQVKAENFDAVVVAIGAKEFIPPVPGADGKNVIHAMKLYGNEDKLGSKIVIVGGGFVGCEACVHLQSMGKTVDVVEMTDELMSEAHAIEEERFFTEYYMTHEYTMDRTDLVDVPEIDRVKIHLSTRCVEVTDKGVVVEKDGQRSLIEADTVIMSTGFRPDKALVESYRGTAFDVIVIGDSDHVADLLNTSTSAYRAGQQI